LLPISGSTRRSAGHRASIAGTCAAGERTSATRPTSQQVAAGSAWRAVTARAIECAAEAISAAGLLPAGQSAGQKIAIAIATTSACSGRECIAALPACQGIAAWPTGAAKAISAAQRLPTGGSARQSAAAWGASAGTSASPCGISTG
jgi:hypothetical protein